MKEKLYQQINIGRTIFVPVVATAALVIFWWQYNDGANLWWIALIGVILLRNLADKFSKTN